jgi:glycosyltransferase involved in cell wall biosynthesis
MELGKLMGADLNVIFMGTFPYPQGMAGTKRIQHAIEGLKGAPNVTICVIVLTQSSRENALSGRHMGIPYQTVMGDLFRLRMALLFPLFYIRARRALKRAYRAECDNVIYNYEGPNLHNIGILAYAKSCGYKIVLDVVEDYDTGMKNSRSLYYRIKIVGIRYLKRKVKHLASGIVVISSHLERKYRELTHFERPIHYRPISVDFSWFGAPPIPFGETVTLFYAGSFGKKDGLFNLLDAFDRLAVRRANVLLVLTGQGKGDMMRQILSRIASSPFKNRIDYKGYLDDEAYYAVLNSADIPCMTRIESPFAQAGFPFKLGEFLATGKPVIVSRVCDIASILKDGENAMLVNPDDPSDIVHAVEYLLDNSDKAIAMGERGREAARRLFDLRLQGRALQAFLRGL